MRVCLLAAAVRPANEGLVELHGDSARATEALVAKAETFHAAKGRALDEVHAKQACERA